MRNIIKFTQRHRININIYLPNLFAFVIHVFKSQYWSGLLKMNDYALAF